MINETETPPWVWSGTIPSLNGLRALAIGLVVASHYNRGFPGSWSLGHFGVTTFFVLSGFLITLLLIRERNRSGQISLLGFYQRRALRILPAYLTFMGVMAILDLCGVINPSALTWITALTYTSCFFTMTINPNLAHSWSLSVEEHFYMLWPLLFQRARRHTTVWIVLLLAAASPLIRYALARLNIPALDINYSTPGQMGSLAVGCLTAFLVTGQFLPRARTFLARFPGVVLGIGVGGLALSLLIFRSDKILHDAVTDPIRAVAFGLVMLGILYMSSGNWLSRFLNTAPLNVMGILSYSLYLWQQVFARNYQLIPGGFPVSLALLFAAAGSSYLLIESPFLRLKDRLSTARREAAEPGSPVNSADVSRSKTAAVV